MFPGLQTTMMSAAYTVMNSKGGGISNDDKDNKQPESGSKIPKWKVICEKIVFIFLICYCLFGIKACFDIKPVRCNDITLKYTVTGYKTVNRHAKYYYTDHYLFLHNDKLGDYTFTVTPKVMYDAENGQKTMFFSNDYYELFHYADNESTRKKLKDNYEMFGLNKYQVDNFRFLDNFCILGMIAGYLLLIMFDFLLFHYHGEYMHNTKYIGYSFIIWTLSLIACLIISLS